MLKICFITGSRAEYGLLKELLFLVKSSKNHEMQLVVTGMHLSKEFGLTYKEIISDEFKINEKVDLKLNDYSACGIVNSMGLGMIGFSSVLSKLRPDLIVIVGDRYEMLCAINSALIFNIPVAHIHGGEITEGAFDNSIRHAITKMSHLHFASTEVYRNRIIQMGENPLHTHNVGGLGVDAIKKIKFLNILELQKELCTNFLEKKLLIAFHPETLNIINIEKQIKILLSALKGLNDTTLIFTGSNSDTKGNKINIEIKKFVSSNNNSIYFDSLGQKKFLSCLKHVDAIVGNSSSGILEAPSFKIGTVNIGNRQKGRIKSKTVIDCNFEKSEIINSIKKVYTKNFKETLSNETNPYGDGGSSKKIFNILSNYDDFSFLLKKQFFDITK